MLHTNITCRALVLAIFGNSFGVVWNFVQIANGTQGNWGVGWRRCLGYVCDASFSNRIQTIGGWRRSLRGRACLGTEPPAPKTSSENGLHCSVNGRRGELRHHALCENCRPLLRCDSRRVDTSLEEPCSSPYELPPKTTRLRATRLDSVWSWESTNTPLLFSSCSRKRSKILIVSD
jgi:hypothetical protein